MKNYFFPLIKFIVMLGLLLFIIMTAQGSTGYLGMELFGLSCLLSVTVLYELTDRFQRLLLLLEAAVLFVLLFVYGSGCLLLLPIVGLDLLTCWAAPAWTYFLPLSGAFFSMEDAFYYLSFCGLMMMIYYQEHRILREYRGFLTDFELQEDYLKHALTDRDFLMRRELAQNSLRFENKILAEKARLSQALHDKLGHRVNGSIYQLEACKVLMAQDPDVSRRMITGVVDTLRESMDEIRALLRAEKPDRQRMALLQLDRLCESCQEKYGIAARLIVENPAGANTALIGETIWEVILDNTFEAVSNALKYADCRSITIQLTIHNRLIRCHIADDGNGCPEIIPGMGLQGMKQRTREIGGILSVEGQAGFSINMIIPFEITAKNNKEREADYGSEK